MNRFWQNTFAFWLFFFIILLIYQKTFESPFIFDDRINISDNQAIRMQNLSYAAIKKAILASHSLSRPVANISFALNYYFHQYRVWGYHATNLAIHILTGFFLFLLFKRTLLLTPELNPQDPSECKRIHWVSVFAALIWLTHPMQTQSVTYIVQRMNSMGGMFFIASMLLYNHARSAGSPLLRLGLWGGVLLTALMAFGTKLNTATLPFFMLLYECFFYRNLDWAWGKRVIGIFIGVIVLLAGAVLLIFSIDPLAALLNTYQGYAFTPVQRVMTESRVVIFYLFQLALPYPGHLNLDHDFPLSQSLIDPLTTLLSLGALLLALGLAAFQARRSRLLAFAILWYFGNLVIESSIIGLELIYDHRVYLPSMFLILAVVALGTKRIKSGKLAVLLGGGIVLLFSFWTYERNQDWQSGITIWRDAMQKSSQNARPYNNIGVLLDQKGRDNASLTYYRKALALDPDYRDAHNNLGNALKKQGKLDQAIKHYNQALRIDPNYSEAHNNLGAAFQEQGKLDQAIKHYNQALQIEPNYSEAHNNLGLAFYEQGKFDQAIEQYDQAIKNDPTYSEAYNNLGVALQERELFNEAINHFNMAIKIDPNYSGAYNNLGSALQKQGRIDEAIKQYKKAIQIDPNYLEAHLNLGIVLKEQGRIDEAIKYYQNALEIDPNHLETHNNLAIALKEQGRIDEAIKHYQKALQIDPDNLGVHNNLGNTLQEQGRTDAAIVHYQKALRIDPNNLILHYNLGNTLRKLGKNDEAIRHFKQAIHINPNFSMAYSQIGKTLASVGKLEYAIDYYQKAFEIDKRNMEAHAKKKKMDIDPQFIDALDRLSLINANKKNYMKSISYLKKMIILRPDFVNAYYNIACYYSLAHHVEESIAWLKKAINKGFNNWEMMKADKDLENIRSSSFYMSLADEH